MKRYPQVVILIIILPLLMACASGPSGLLRPNGVALAADGSLYVMDRGHNRVVHLAATGQVLNTFGRLGTGPGDIYAGWDITLDEAENIYLCHQTRDESGSARSSDGVKVFNSAGQFVRTIGEQTYSTNSEVSNTPYGLDIDDQGRVFVADFDAQTIRVFTGQGQPLATLAGQSEGRESLFNNPVDVAVDDTRQLLYVTDPYLSQVHQFGLVTDAAGALSLTPLLSFGSYGHDPGQLAYPQNVVVDDPSGRVYVSDMANRRIQVFDSQGKYLAALAVPGNWQVIGFDVGPDGIVYAADALNNVIWVLGPEGQPPYRLEVKS